MYAASVSFRTQLNNTVGRTFEHVARPWLWTPMMRLYGAVDLADVSDANVNTSSCHRSSFVAVFYNLINSSTAGYWQRFSDKQSHYGRRGTVPKIYVGNRGGSTFGQGALAPRFTCCPQIQKLADRSDVISEVPKCSKIQFSGVCPGPHWGTYSAPSDPLTDGESARYPLSRTPPPLSALRALSEGYRLQSLQPY